MCLRQLVELKNGETYNGHMVQCDSWMNVHLREVICTSKARTGALCSCTCSHFFACLGVQSACPQDGDRFWRIPETYIRGNTIKYLRVPDEVRGPARCLLLVLLRSPCTWPSKFLGCCR